MDVLLQFVQNHQNVLVVGYLWQHFQLLQLHIKWVVIIHEKDLEFLGKKQWSFLQDKVDRLENKVADLIFHAKSWLLEGHWFCCCMFWWFQRLKGSPCSELLGESKIGPLQSWCVRVCWRHVPWCFKLTEGLWADSQWEYPRYRQLPTHCSHSSQSTTSAQGFLWAWAMARL